jgi:chromosome segregation ATPase
VQTGTRRRAHGDDGEDGGDVVMTEDPVRRRLADALRGMGRKYNSYALMEMASAATADPFGKIRGLIEDMIAKLMNEAAQEQEHKAFCDEEMGKSRKTKDEKSLKMDNYRTRIDEADTTKAELEEAVAALQAEVSELDKNQEDATKIRAEEHATLTAAADDYKQSAEAVEKAMTVLSEYYGKAFVQVKASTSKRAPEFGSKSGGDAASTILGILEVAASDFTKLLAETEATEAEAEEAYTKVTDDNKVSKAAKLAEVKGKESEIKSLTVGLSHHREDYKTTSKEYDAVLTYMDKLKPECETKVMSYDEKKARRESEIEGLKEALEIIEGKGIPEALVQVQKH